MIPDVLGDSSGEWGRPRLILVLWNVNNHGSGIFFTAIKSISGI